MVDVKKCPECSGNMIAGQLIDQSYVTSGPQHWAKRASSFMGIGLDQSHPIISFRCEKCGYLKNYAPEEKLDHGAEEDLEEFEDRRESNPIMM